MLVEFSPSLLAFELFKFAKIETRAEWSCEAFVRRKRDDSAHAWSERWQRGRANCHNRAEGVTDQNQRSCRHGRQQRLNEEFFITAKARASSERIAMAW